MLHSAHLAMPCHAMPCHAMPCHAMPCHAMPCHAMPCHAMPCHAIYVINMFTTKISRVSDSKCHHANAEWKLEIYLLLYNGCIGAENSWMTKTFVHTFLGLYGFPCAAVSSMKTGRSCVTRSVETFYQQQRQVSELSAPPFSSV